jgi:DNA repair exonuclease SbcCD ATPase subunit
MTTSLDTIRYHSGIAGEEVADMVDSLEQEVSTLREQVKKLEALVVMRCDLDVPPQFSQGLQSHELLEPVTAEHCKWFVGEIAGLREQVEKLTEESVVLRASSRSKLETISSLELQVSKLTKERDTEIARNRPLQSLIKLTEETKSFLLKKSEENKEAVKQLDSERQANALLTEELAALAEQNEKFRETLSRWRYQNLSYNWCCGNCGAVDGDEHKEGCALSLHDLASPVLNRIRAEGVRKASTLVSLVRNDWASAGDNLSVQAAEYLISALDARAAELEKESGK